MWMEGETIFLDHCQNQGTKTRLIQPQVSPPNHLFPLSLHWGDLEEIAELKRGTRRCLMFTWNLLHSLMAKQSERWFCSSCFMQSLGDWYQNPSEQLDVVYLTYVLTPSCGPFLAYFRGPVQKPLLVLGDDFSSLTSWRWKLGVAPRKRHQQSLSGSECAALEPNTPTEPQTGSMESESRKPHLFGWLHPSLLSSSEKNSLSLLEVNAVFRIFSTS